MSSQQQSPPGWLHYFLGLGIQSWMKRCISELHVIFSTLSQQGFEILTLAASALAKVQSQSFLKENFEILKFLMSFRSCFHGFQKHLSPNSVCFHWLDTRFTQCLYDLGNFGGRQNDSCFVQPYACLKRWRWPIPRGDFSRLSQLRYH